MLETCKFLHIESCVVQARGIPAVKATRGMNLSCKQHLSEAHGVCVCIEFYFSWQNYIDSIDSIDSIE